jgi:hypothetical protein
MITKQFDLGLAGYEIENVLESKNSNGYFDAAVFAKEATQTLMPIFILNKC